MRRQAPLTTFSVEFGYEVWDEPANTDIDVYTLNLAGHYVSRGGFGGYFILPITFLDLQLGVFEDSDTAIGNIELGFLYNKWFRQTALVFNAGIGLGTAQDDGASAYQFFGSFTRLTDVALHTIDSTWLRIGLSPMGRSGKLLWRADVGIDLALDEPETNEISPILHINIGGGIDLGSAQLVAELVNVVTDDEANDDSGSTVTLGARFSSGNLRPGIGLLLPIDFDNVDLEMALLASLAVRVPSL
jgi:hypothetical protein